MRSTARKIVIFLIAIVVVFVLIKVAVPVYGEWQAFHAWKGSGDVRIIEYEVQHGEALWSIAYEHRPKGKDIREFVWEILNYNGLDNVVLQPGQELLIPVEDKHPNEPDEWFVAE